MKKLIVILAILACMSQVAWAQDDSKDKNATPSATPTEQAKPADQAKPSDEAKPAEEAAPAPEQAPEEQTGPVNNWNDFADIIRNSRQFQFHTTFGAEYQSKGGNFLFYKRYRVPENGFFLRAFDASYIGAGGNRFALTTHDISEPDWGVGLKVGIFPISFAGEAHRSIYEIYGFDVSNRLLDRTRRYQGNYTFRGVSQRLKGLEVSYTDTSVRRTLDTQDLNSWHANTSAISYNFGLGENLDVRAKLSHHLLVDDAIGFDTAKTDTFNLDLTTKGPHFDRVALFGGLTYSKASVNTQESDQTYWDANAGLNAYRLFESPLNFRAYVRMYDKTNTPTLNTRQSKYDEYGASLDYRDDVIGSWKAGYVRKDLTQDRLLINDPGFLPIKYTSLTRADVAPFTVTEKPKIDSYFITGLKNFSNKVSLFHQTDAWHVAKDPISDVVAVGSDPLFPNRNWRSKTRLTFTPDTSTRFFLEDLYTAEHNSSRDQKLTTNVVTGSAFRQFNQKTSAMFSVARYDYEPLIDANLVKYDTDSWVYDFTVNHTVQRMFNLGLDFSHAVGNGAEQYTQDGFNCNVRLLGKWPLVFGFEYGRRASDYYLTQDNHFYGVNVGLDFTF